MKNRNPFQHCGFFFYVIVVKNRNEIYVLQEMFALACAMFFFLLY